MPSEAQPVALVLRALGLGDLLAGVPALRALRARLPGHEIVLATPPVLQPLVELTGVVDRLLPQQELEPIDWSSPSPDVAVDLHGNGPASHHILEALRPRSMVAFDPPGTGRGRPVWDDDEHEHARWCRLVTSAFGGTADPGDLRLAAPEVTAPAEGAAVVHPGAAFAARRWPPERFAALAAELARGGEQVVVTGSADERPLALDVAARAGLPDDAVLAGRTDLAHLAAVVARARVVVCGDTGVGHLASAFGTPSVLLFGPTPPWRWGPPPGPHTVLWKGDEPGDPWADRPDPALLRISVPEVVEALRRTGRAAGRIERAAPGTRGMEQFSRPGAPRRGRRGEPGMPPREMGESHAALAGFEQGAVLTVVAEGAELRIVAANAADRARAGRELVGESLREILDMEFGAHVVDRVEEVYLTGRGWSAREWCRAPAGPGDAPASGRHLALEVAPWLDPDGEVRGVVLQGIDLGDDVAHREADALPASTGPPAAHEVVAAMQDALLPTDLPVVPGLDVAARYLLQEDLGRSGGDWFDAVPLADGSIALVVGDVVGSGVPASAIMGQLRAVLHARLAGGVSGAEALVGLDRFARGLPEAHGATVCVVHVDADTGELVYTTAGHPPPLLLQAHGATRYLSSTGGRPLGVSRRPAGLDTFPERRDRLEPDAMVLLYSDGAVERPGRSATENTVELARVVSSIRETSLDEDSVAELEVTRVCERTLDSLAWLSGYDDDITLLAAQRVPRVVPLRVTVPAVPQSADRLRRELRRWLDSLALSELDGTVLVHAANELAANAIDHAYPHPRPHAGSSAPGDEGGDADELVEMSADLLATGVVEVRVRDHGQWRDPDLRERYRGRGLALTSGLVDELDIVPGEDEDGPGTVATVRHRVRRTASLLSPVRERPPPARQEQQFTFSVDEDRRRVVVSGTVGEEASDKLLAVLRTMSRGGAVTVTADLSGVSQLPSVAVRALYEVYSQMQPPAELRLQADPGTPAQHVLGVVGLPRS